MRQERLAREKELVERTGIAADYIATFDALAGISAARAARRVHGVPSGHAGDVGRRAARSSCVAGLASRASEATRADAQALMRVPEFDAGFPAEEMERRVRRQSRGDGRESRCATVACATTPANGRASARARSARPVVIPSEVYLVLRPHGGPERLAGAAARTRPRAAFREHGRRAAVRASLARRQLDHRRLRDAVRPPHARPRLAGALHAARDGTTCRATCAPPDSRSCSFCGGTARSWSTKSSSTAAACRGRRCPTSTWRR